MRHLFKLTIMMLLGCSNPLSINYDHRRFEPPIAYRGWWQDVLECATLPNIRMARFERVRFYIVDTETKFVANGVLAYAGEYELGLYFNNINWTDERTVKHEMMHAATNVNTHPKRLFQKCSL